MSLENILYIITPMLLAIFMIYFVYRRYRDVKSGLPLEDERSKMVINLAASRAFYITLYWLLAISMFDSIFADMFGVEKLEAHQAISLGIVGMALFFMGGWFYFSRKGESKESTNNKQIYEQGKN
jgi:hypothetical protein